MATFTPLYDRIVVKRDDPETKRGSLFIPESSKEKPSKGTVLSVGAGSRNGTRTHTGHEVLNPLYVNPGDVVLFGKYAGTEIEIDGEEVVLMREEEVLGVLRE